MSKRTSNSKSRPVLNMPWSGKGYPKNPTSPGEDDSFETVSEISDASDHEQKLATLQAVSSHKHMATYQLTERSRLPRLPSRNKKGLFLNTNQQGFIRDDPPSAPPALYGYDNYEEFLYSSNPFKTETTPGGPNSPRFKFFKQFEDENADYFLPSFNRGQSIKPKVTFDMGRDAGSLVAQPLENEGDDAIDITDKEKTEEEENKYDLGSDQKQEMLLQKLRQALTGGEDGKVGWEVFVKNARKARISSAFMNAMEDAMFDATNKELDIINDKTYVIDQKPASRKSLRKKGDEAPKLRKILEKHKIISKKNLEKKALSRVLNNLARRKSKARSMREWMTSLRREVHYKLVVLKFFRKAILLHPKGKFRLIWDIIALLLIIYDLFYVPYQLGFDLSDTGFLYYFDMSKDIFFFVDFFTNFFTGYYDRHGTLIMEAKAIVRNYLRSSWIIPDFITSMPIALIVDASLSDDQNSHNASIVKLLRIARFVRLIRVLKAMRLMRIFNKVEELFYSLAYRSVKGIFSILFYILLFAHWAACLFHFVGMLDLQDSGDSWLTRYDIDTQSLYDRYVASMYWSIATMITVGFGDIVPATTAERLVAIVAMLSGCVLFAYSMNTIGMLVQNINARASKTKQLYFSVNKYMQEKNVSKQFRQKVLQYLDYTTESQSQTKDVEDEIFTSLSATLQGELKKDINGQVLRDNLLFQSTFGSTFRSALSYYLEEHTYSPGEVIFNEMDKTQSLYFLATGIIDIFVSRCGVSLSTIERGTHFGEYAFFTGKERTAGARSHNFTHVFVLKKDIFITMIEDFPFEKETFHMIKDKLTILNNYENLKMKCFICDQDGHYARYCFRTHHVPDPKQAIDEYKEKRQKFAKEYERTTKRKRFHALPGKKLVALRLRDLARVSPPEVKKYLQQSEFSKSISMMNNTPSANMLTLPQPNHGRRRSRTIGFNEIAMLNLGNRIEDLVQDENTQERKEMVSHQKKRVVNLLKQSTLAPPKTENANKLFKQKTTAPRRLEVDKEEEKEKEKDKDKDKESKSSKSSKSSSSKSSSKSKSRSSSSSSSSSSGSSEKKDNIPSPRTAINQNALNRKRKSIGKLFLETPAGQPQIAFDLVAVEGQLAQVIKFETTEDLGIRDEIVLQPIRFDEVVMDMVMTYQVYFPHNNVKRILETINEPEKIHKRRGGRMGSDTPKKLSEMFSRSSTDSFSKKKSKSPAARAKESRVKSVFVAPRHSVWGLANRMKSKKSIKPHVSHVSPLGMIAMKNQALAGLIPHIIGGDKSAIPGKRRMSRSLGVLDALPPLSVDSERADESYQSGQSYQSHNVEQSVEQSAEQSASQSAGITSEHHDENVGDVDADEKLYIESRTYKPEIHKPRRTMPAEATGTTEKPVVALAERKKIEFVDRKVMRRGVSNFH